MRHGVGGEVDAVAALARMRNFLDVRRPTSPCLVVDLTTIRSRYRELTEALPNARIFHTVRANPAPDVVRALVQLGACFGVASPPEIELCLANGARAENIFYGNTIKKRADIAAAHKLGVRLFTSDSVADIEALAQCAPGSSVFCRITLADIGATPSVGAKLGCRAAMAVDLLIKAGELGLTPTGVSFHPGSRQLDPQVWDRGIAEAARVAEKLAATGIAVPDLNIGGGLPRRHLDYEPLLADYASAIDISVRDRFAAAGLTPPRLALEPGRFLVADAGLLRSEVVLVSRQSNGAQRRWIYLDVGRFNGLAETEDEQIAYRLATPGRSGELGPVLLAGPTCDGMDVIHQHTQCQLPLSLEIGDKVEFLDAGAYTAGYFSSAFNGFAPLSTYCIDEATTWSSQLQRVLAEMLGDSPVTMDRVARHMMTSKRSLQRRLAEEGTTWRRELDRARRARIESRPPDTLSGRASLARSVGYADDSSLYRARRRWSADA